MHENCRYRGSLSITKHISGSQTAVGLFFCNKTNVLLHQINYTTLIPGWHQHSVTVIIGFILLVFKILYLIDWAFVLQLTGIED